MKISLVINTCSGDAMVVGGRNPYRSRRYGERASLLRTEIFPRCLGFDEVVVAGQFPPGLAEEFKDFQFVRVAPQRRNRWDGLLYREVGARFTTGDILVFCHDDHAPGENFASLLRDLARDHWDILVPKRIHLRTGEELNNGRAEGYMGGHVYACRRKVWAAFPLAQAPNEWWDIWFTPVWTAAGLKIVWTDDLLHYDVEATESEL